MKKRWHEASTFFGSFIYWKDYVKNKNQFKSQFEIMICHMFHWMDGRIVSQVEVFSTKFFYESLELSKYYLRSKKSLINETFEKKIYKTFCHFQYINSNTITMAQIAHFYPLLSEIIFLVISKIWELNQQFSLLNWFLVNWNDCDKNDKCLTVLRYLAKPILISQRA